MDQAEVQALFRRFAAPLASYGATSSARKELAEMLARSLWTAPIAGPEMEEETWNVLKTTGKMDDDSLLVVRQVYLDEMKPVVREEQLADLRRRFRVRRTDIKGPE